MAGEPVMTDGWRFESVRHGVVRQVRELWLYPELSCSPMVADYPDLGGEGQLREYVGCLHRHYPQYLERDAVPIDWSVRAEPYGIWETAPFRPQNDGLPVTEDFLTHFTWPVSMATGERIDWFRLPVRHSRFPEFGRALGWAPSPLQPYAPLASIMASKSGVRLTSRMEGRS